MYTRKAKMDEWLWNLEFAITLLNSNFFAGLSVRKKHKWPTRLH